MNCTLITRVLNKTIGLHKPVWANKKRCSLRFVFNPTKAEKLQLLLPRVSDFPLLLTWTH